MGAAVAQLMEKLDQKGKVTGPQRSVSQRFLQATARHQKCPLKSEFHVGKSGELQQPQMCNSTVVHYTLYYPLCLFYFCVLLN